MFDCVCGKACKGALLFLCAFFFYCAVKTPEAGSVFENADAPAEDSMLHEIQNEKSTEGGVWRDERLIALMNAMSETQKYAQLFLVNIAGNARFNPVEFDDAGNPAIPGGCLLFSYNIAATQEETKSFTRSIKTYCDERNIVPPYLAIDHEGGSVNRLRVFDPKFPAAWTIAQTLTPQQAEALYYEQGALLNALGIHLNLAPVVEIAAGKNESFLGERSYGDAQNVALYAKAALSGYERASVAAALKHFPLSASDDPHDGAASVSINDPRLVAALAPYKLLVDGAAAVLMSHVTITGAVGGESAGLSRYWVTDVLRSELGFEGLIVSDDIYMAALGGSEPEAAAEKAIEAGVTVLMISEKRFLPALNALKKRADEDELFRSYLENAVLRVLGFKAAHGIIGAAAF
jgi:beta-N-acetylhexosaminidase